MPVYKTNFSQFRLFIIYTKNGIVDHPIRALSISEAEQRRQWHPRDVTTSPHPIAAEILIMNVVIIILNFLP